MVKLFLSIWLLWLPPACGSSSLGQQGTSPPSHALFDKLLQKHVSEAGSVDYAGFRADRAQLEEYLALLSEQAPDRQTWSEAEQLAYWINAYNAFTVKLIIDHYPVKSIRDIGPKLSIPLVQTVWHLEFFEIGGQKASLDEIEHAILRKEFEEPRIHFAINCASISCPALAREAYTADRLEEQLEQAARRFINDPTRNRIQSRRVEISEIFSWFKGDFTKSGSLIDFLNRYADVKIHSDARIGYLPYDWNLNE
ncbi:DUF547 domain-containing protein [Lunatimonas salinarum]|uniref:DUF547 domain-containing protein n=1 Tax=Lunatimonas salinarum TaxID=1774590 RepID=UPI001ADFFB05|nr:DUF547 domain-containing protein [Lunatimonas salinarum]